MKKARESGLFSAPKERKQDDDWKRYPYHPKQSAFS
jgi:hypothetical protein